MKARLRSFLALVILGRLDGRHKVLLEVDVGSDGLEAYVGQVLAPFLHVGLVHVEDVDLAASLLLENLEKLFLVLGDVLRLGLLHA